LSEPIPGFPIPVEDGPRTDETQVIEVRFTPGLAPPAPEPLPYEVVEWVTPEPLPPAFEVVEERVVEAQVVVPPQPPWQPRTRRELYARLARIRRLRAAWQKLKPVLGDPHCALDRPLEVLLYLEAVAEMRPLLDWKLVGEPWRPGGLVAAIIRQPLALQAFRALLRDQRQAVAADWRTAEAELSHEYRRLRELSRSGKPRRPFRRRSRMGRVVRWVLRNPETVLVVLAAAAAALALVRSSAGR
jgi:hypothetical protein